MKVSSPSVFRASARPVTEKGTHAVGISAQIPRRTTQKAVQYKTMARQSGAAVEATSSEEAGEARRIVICGGGIIGTSIAYYLAKKGLCSTVVDRSEVAAAASGRAGGFLALDWNDASPLGPFSRMSYAMHEGLEQELGVSLDYRKLDTFAVEAIEQGGLMHSGKGSKHLPKWVDGHILSASRLGSSTTTAQVHPRKLTEAFMARATALVGSRFLRGTVRGVQTNDSNADARVTAVELAGGDVLAADVVVIALGPWSQLAAAWLPLPMAVSAQKYHSAVLRPSTAAGVTAAALFTSVRRNTISAREEPEIYPRPHGEVYVCGCPEAAPLPPAPGQVTVHEDTCAHIQETCAAVSSCLRDAQVVVRQACYLPLTPDALPVMGAVPGVAGAFVATGHGCWGILNAPASGLAMAELIADGAATAANLEPFSPQRFFDM